MTMHDPRLSPRPSEHTVSFRSDVVQLSGTLFSPARPPIAAIVLHGATAVPHRFYAAFARWLTDRGYAVLTYDYRGFGTSRGGRGGASLATWGVSDQAAAQRALEREFPGVPVWVIGHSLGGLMLPFQEGAGRVSRLITVASGPVHFSDHPLLAKFGAVFLWHTVGPVLTGLLGRLPGWVLGGKLDLPGRVYWQWRRWCTTPGFHLGDVGKTLPVPDFAAFTGEARIVAVSDDVMVPTPAVWRLMQLYPEAWKKQHVIRPADIGVKRIGHIDVFHPRNAAAWPGILGWDD